MVAPVTATRDTIEGDVASQPAVPLLESKLHPPARVSALVPRPRLVGPLLDREGPPVVALIAGPGYGKTTLLSQWVDQERRAVAWLTLDELDNDPAMLVAYLEAAFGRIHRLATTAGIASSTDAGHPVHQAVPRLLDQLHRWHSPAVLVLDDAHRIVNPTSLDVLTAILDHLPAGFRVAIAGRQEPAMPLARWRAGRQVLDIGEADLALDPSETASLVAAAGARMTPEELQQLISRTEGWAAATYLAALAHVRAAETDGDAPDVAAPDRFLTAYLGSEVRAGLTPDEVDLLRRTAILETVTPRAAKALAGTDGSGSRLRAIARRNLLVHEVGATGTTFRYHNLLREFLLGELERDAPGTLQLLHAEASRWYVQEGDLDRAVEHAISSRDTVEAARLTTAAIVPALYGGRAATVDRWLAAIDPSAFTDYPPLAAMAAWAHLLAGRADAADRMADIADGLTFDGAPADQSSSFVSQRALLRAEMCRRGPADALADAELAADAEAGTRWRTASLRAVGWTRWLTGDEEGAETALHAALDHGRATGGAGSSALAKLATIQLRRGDWLGAQVLVDRARAMHREARWDGLLTAFTVHTVSGRVAIARGDVATGRAELVRAQLVRPTASHAAPWASVDTLLELARAYLAISDPGGAQTAIREAEAIVRVRPALGVLVAELVELRGRVGGAADALAGSSTLTSAELRVLPLLPTYLSFQDIADRLGISRNTVKTHAMSIYGKLWASSRGEAVERAVELGLLEPYPGLMLTTGALEAG